MESVVGKILKNAKDEEFIVLSEFAIKEIPCVYAMKVEKEEKEGEKNFFQLVAGEVPTLVNIKSKKLLRLLSEALMEKTKADDRPRRIQENESIQAYLAYLDEFYRSRVATII